MSRLKKHNKKSKTKRRFYIISSIIAICAIFGVVFSLDLIPGMGISNLKNMVSKSDDSSISGDDSTDDESSSPKTVNLDGFLFVGDSYTYLLTDTIKQNNPTAIIKAVSGVQPAYWNEHFSELPEDDEVNGVVLLIGVNGVTYSDNLPEKKKLITALAEKYADKTIYIQEVFPVGSSFTSANPASFNEAIENNNKETKTYCDNYDNVYYINATDGLVTEDGYLKFTYDGLHIDTDKQDEFYNNIVAAAKSTK